MSAPDRRARGYRPRFASPHQDAVLDSILAKARANGDNGVGVFDLDGTLFDNRPRIIQIWRELGSRADLAPLYKIAPEHFLDWSHEDTMRTAGLTDSEIAQVKDKAEAAFFRYFFDGDYCPFDQAMPGAATLLWQCYKAGLRIVYLTGRHEQMRAGSEASLLRNGFPIHRPGTELVLKPYEEEQDVVFKEEALREIRHLGEPVIFVDNEPANINKFDELAPDALKVWMETDHSPRPITPNADIPGIRGWLRTTDAGAQVGVGMGPAGSTR